MLKCWLTEYSSWRLRTLKSVPLVATAGSCDIVYIKTFSCWTSVGLLDVSSKPFEHHGPLTCGKSDSENSDCHSYNIEQNRCFLFRQIAIWQESVWSLSLKMLAKTHSTGDRTRAFDKKDDFRNMEVMLNYRRRKFQRLSKQMSCH